MRNAWVSSFAVAAVLAASPAFAQSEGKKIENAVRGTQGRYGDAGCGLGAMVFGDQGGFVQILSWAFNNLITSNQPFAITTGTSNCQGATSGAHASRVFVEVNREALAKDIARGSGETIATLSWMNGCKDSRAVGAALQKKFSAIFPSDTTPNEAVTSTILETLKGEPALACEKVG